jgi:hypothetical protein
MILRECLLPAPITAKACSPTQKFHLTVQYSTVDCSDNCWGVSATAEIKDMLDHVLKEDKKLTEKKV